MHSLALARDSVRYPTTVLPVFPRSDGAVSTREASSCPFLLLPNAGFEWGRPGRGHLAPPWLV